MKYLTYHKLTDNVKNVIETDSHTVSVLLYLYTLVCYLNEWGQEDCLHNVFYRVIP